MRPSTRILAAGIALMLVAASCGAPSGEAPAVSTPTPGGVTAAATPAPAAAPTAVPAPKTLIVYGDFVRGQAGLTDDEKKTADNPPAALHCVVMSRFPQGSRIVWRVKVIDPVTAKELGDQDLTSVTITFPTNKTEPLKYGGHGGTKENPLDRFWAVGFTVPDDYPTGIFAFKVEAKSKEGATGTFGFDQFKVPTAQIQIVPKGLTRRL